MSNSEDWPQPIPFDTIERPSFPTDSLPPALKNYVLSVAEATQTPVDMPSVAALVIMAICVQGKYTVEAKADWREPLNLYGIIIAKPAERKSAIMSYMTAYVNQYERDWNEAHKLKIEQSKVARKCLGNEIARLMDIAANSGDQKDHDALMRKQDELTDFKEMRKLRLLIDDATPEALISLMAENSGRLAVVSSEGGIFEILKGRYTPSMNIDAFLKAHSGDIIKIDRKGRDSESIEHPCLTVLLSIQPQVLNDLMSNEVFRGRGLTARFIYSFPVSHIGNRNYATTPIPSKHSKVYKKLCYTLLDIPSNDSPQVLYLSERAHDDSAIFANKLEPRLINDLENMSDFAGKLHGTVLRIAGILHLADGNTDEQPISGTTMRSAIKIGRYFLRHAMYVYRIAGADKRVHDAEYILKQLKKQATKEITKNGIFRLCRGHFKSSEDMNGALALLEAHGYIREGETQYKGAGRYPSPKFDLHPSLWIK